MQRYFAKEKRENNFILKEEDFYHIKTVMRMKNKEEVIVVYEESPYLCEVDIDQKVVHIKNQIQKSEEVIPYVRLIIPALKEQKIDFILQKATELGVSEFIFYEAKRNMVKIKDFDKKKIRWERIVKEASEQSHRNTIPNIQGVYSVSKLNGLEGVKILCSTREKSENIKNTLKLSKTCDKMNIVIGPEGGLEEQEEKDLMGFQAVTLGARIMRAETVPLFIMSVINYEYME